MVYYIVLWFTLSNVAAILICSQSLSVGVYFNVLCGAYSAYLRFSSVLPQSADTCLFI